MSFDFRLTPARPDLAAAHLRGQIEAARFVQGEPREVVAGQAPVRRAPAPDAPLETEALRGERVVIYEWCDGWAWGQLETDGYVGWLPARALSRLGSAPPTHRVGALRTFVFPGPSIKLPPVDALPMGARVSVEGHEGALARLAEGGFVPASHLLPLGAPRDADPVAVAERFLGTPYLWGGKTGLGVDCSGLVQVAWASCGVALPRDSDMQQAACGEVVPHLGAIARGDLVFWRGHVAIARDRVSLIHANAHHMAVAVEPIATAVQRVALAASEIAAIKRAPRAG